MVAASCFGAVLLKMELGNLGLSQGGGRSEQFQIPVSVSTKPSDCC